MSDDSRQRLHDAITETLDDGELAVCWVLTIDVAGRGDSRYLAHRSGGGCDGDDAPMAWTALGMLRASVGVAENQLISMTIDVEDDDEDAPSP
jgi:hypothetical protein